MFNKILIPTFVICHLTLVICGIAAADVITSNGYTLYDTINSGGMTLQNSGYTLQDSKGEGIAGSINNNGYTFIPGIFGVLGGGTSEAGTGEAAFYSLKIIRAPGGNGKGVRVYWDTSVFSNPDIYSMTGDGTGQYKKEYDGAVWQLIYTDGAKVANKTVNGEILSNVSGTSFEVANQIVTGVPEVYFKALPKQADANNPNADAFKLGAVVGKYDLTIKTGFNLNSIPLDMLAGRSIDDAFVDEAGGALRNANNEVYFFDENSRLTIKAKYENNTWTYSPNTPFGLVVSNGYWVYENRPEKRMSVLGAIINFENERLIRPNFALISNPTPIRYLSLNDAGIVPRGNDEVYFFDINTKLQEKMVNDGGSWKNVSPGHLPFGLYPGVGYWYWNATDNFTWKLKP